MSDKKQKSGYELESEREARRERINSYRLRPGYYKEIPQISSSQIKQHTSEYEQKFSFILKLYESGKINVDELCLRIKSEIDPLVKIIRNMQNEHQAYLALRYPELVDIF